MFSPADAEVLLKRLLLPALHQEDDLYRSLPLPVALNGLDGNETERQAVLSPRLLRESAVGVPATVSFCFAVLQLSPVQTPHAAALQLPGAPPTALALCASN